jgi:hypothetical protein
MKVHFVDGIDCRTYEILVSLGFLHERQYGITQATLQIVGCGQPRRAGQLRETVAGAAR